MKDGSFFTIANAPGGKKGTVNPVQAGAAGAADTSSQAFLAQFTLKTLVSFAGGTGTASGGAGGGAPAGAKGAANGSASGQGNRSENYGRGGAGDGVYTGSSSGGEAGYAGMIYYQGL